MALIQSKCPVCGSVNLHMLQLKDSGCCIVCVSCSFSSYLAGNKDDAIIKWNKLCANKEEVQKLQEEREYLTKCIKEHDNI